LTGAMKGIIQKIPFVESLRRTRADQLRKDTHINRAIASIRGEIYVEIGVHKGECFRRINAAQKFGIDPSPVNIGNEQLGKGEQLFVMTSDEFFSKHAENAIPSRRINVALVDGLHEFRQVVRDVLNLEKYMSTNGVIFVHDCNPPTREHAADVRAGGGAWNGDAWKIAYYIVKHRPDLSFFTLNCDWGLGVITGFHRTGLRCGELDAQIIEDCKNLDYDYLSQNRKGLLKLRTCYYSTVYFYVISKLRGM